MKILSKVAVRHFSTYFSEMVFSSSSAASRWSTGICKSNSKNSLSLPSALFGGAVGSMCDIGVGLCTPNLGAVKPNTPHYSGLYFPLSRFLSASVIMACASAALLRYRAIAVSMKARSCRSRGSSSPCVWSSHPAGNLHASSIFRAFAWPISLRPHLTCDRYRSDISSFSENSLSIPLSGLSACSARNAESKTIKFSRLVFDASIFPLEVM